MTVTLDTGTAAYLAEHARSETGGNVSALIDRLVRERQLTESVAAHAAYYGPDYWADFDAELAADGGPV